MVVTQKIMKVNLKRKISLFLFVVLIASILFFNHSFYFGTIFISFVVVNEWLHEKYKIERKEHYDKATDKLVNDLEKTISGIKETSDIDYETDDNRSEKIC